MKAILVVDVPEDMRIEDTRALHLTMFNGMFTKDIKIDCPLKPLPKRMEVEKYVALDTLNMSTEHTDIISLGVGWNACLDEILGETE